MRFPRVPKVAAALALAGLGLVAPRPLGETPDGSSL